MLFKSSLSADIKWYSNDTLLSQSDKYEVNNDESSTSLLIKSVDQSDQHEYRLVISNEKETISYKTFLHVEGGKSC